MIGWWPALLWRSPVAFLVTGKAPHVPSATQQCRRGAQAGAQPCENLLVVLVQLAIHRRLLGARDLVVESAPILAWRRTDPDAAVGHAPHHHGRPLLLGYRVHTLLCRGSGLSALFFLAPVNGHDAPFAQQGFEKITEQLAEARHVRPGRRSPVVIATGTTGTILSLTRTTYSEAVGDARTCARTSW